MKYVVSGVTKEELRGVGVDCSMLVTYGSGYYLIENMIMVGKTAFLQIKDGWIYDGAINISSDLSKLKEQPTIKEEIVYNPFRLEFKNMCKADQTRLRKAGKNKCFVLLGNNWVIPVCSSGEFYDDSIYCTDPACRKPTIKEEIVVQGEAFGQCCHATVEMVARHAELFRSVVEGYKGYFGRVPTAAEILWCASEKLGYDITKEGE